MTDESRNVNLLLGTGCAILVVLLAGIGYWFFARSAPAPTPLRPPVAAAKPPAPKPLSAPAPAGTRAAAPSVTPPAPAAPQARANGVIFGAVYDGTGKPAAGANVRLLSEVGPGEEAAFQVEMPADGDGRFYFSELPRKAFQVRAVQGGLAAYRYAGLSSNESVEVFLILMPSAVLGGTVLDPEQRPVAKARLEVLCVNGDEVGRGSPSCVSDEEGRFLFEHLALGLYDLGVYASGFAATVAERLEAGRTDHRIVLERGGRLSGKALEASSRKPAAGAVLRLVRKLGTEGELNAPCASDGAFSLEGLANGAYSFLGAQDGRTVTPFPFVVAVSDGKGQDNVEVLLTPGGSISGRVYDAASDKAIQGVEVLVFLTPDEGFAYLRGNADENGRYSIENLPSGNYEVHPRLPAGLRMDTLLKAGYSRYQVSLAPGEHRQNVDFAIPLGIRISGQVLRADGQPAPYASVEGQQWDANVSRPQQMCLMTADAEGKFMLCGFAPGETIQLQARHSQWGRSGWQEIAIPAQDLDGVRLVLEAHATGSIAGRVVNLQGEPVYGRAGAGLVEAGEERSGVSEEVYTAADGSFVFPKLEAGLWRLRADTGKLDGRGYTGEEQPPEPKEVELAPGAAVTGVVLVLDIRSSVNVSGRVVDEQGVGIENAQVTVSGADVHTQVFTDPMGRFEIAVSDESVRVTASHTDYGSRSLRVDAGTRDIEIVLSANAYLDGWVADATTGRPVTSFQVQFFVRGQTQLLDVSDPEGHFVFPAGASPGANTLTVRAQGYQSTAYVYKFTALGNLYDGNGQPLDRLLITLVPGGDAMQWRVVDAQGAPLAGASIFIAPVRSVARALEAQVFYESDAEGRFVLDQAVPENGVLSAYHPAAGIGIAYIGPDTQGQNQVIVVEPVSSLRGQVLHEGAPVAAAPVVLYTDAGGRDYVAAARTDARGQFEMEGIAAGAYTVKAYTPDEESAREVTQPVVLPDAEGMPLTLSL